MDAERDDRMDVEALADVLEGEGFSPYQARAYVALLELGSVSARELADASDVPQPRIYDVIRTLEDDGYVETYEQDSLHARVPSPKAVANALESRIDELERAVDDIETRWTRPEPTTHEVSVVSRFETLRNRAEAFVGQAAHHVQLSVTPDQYRTLRSALAGARERGVGVHVALHSCSREVAESLPFEDAATEVRWREREAPFLAVVDQRRVCYAEHIGTPREYGVVVNDHVHASVFVWYHLSSLWELWEPIHEAGGEELPRTYLDIRRAAHELVPSIRDGDTPVVRVEGQDVDTGEKRRLTGRVVDIAYEGESGEDGPRSLQSLAGQASLVVETDGGETVTVGGFGAVIEDVSADRVVVEAFA